jgi:hypothetical protein
VAEVSRAVVGGVKSAVSLLRERRLSRTGDSCWKSSRSGCSLADYRVPVARIPSLSAVDCLGWLGAPPVSLEKCILFCASRNHAESISAVPRQLTGDARAVKRWRGL